jgi:hypothetical protein
MATKETSSCGIIELHHLGNEIEDLIYHAELDAEITQVAFVNFSDWTRKRNGEAVAKYIKKHKLGTVTSTIAKRNPSSKHMIKQWTWAVDHKAFKSWLKKVEKKRDEEEDEEEHYKF